MCGPPRSGGNSIDETPNDLETNDLETNNLETTRRELFGSPSHLKTGFIRMGRPDGNRLDGPTMSPVDQLEISGRWTSLV